MLLQLSAISLLAVSAIAAAPQQSDSAAKPQTKSTAVRKAAEPGTSRYTDENGKKWILKKTPFGTAKIADDGEAKAEKPAPATQGMRATESGDSVRFERMTPFGKATWTKKKDDLDESEQAAWDATQRARSNSAAQGK